MTGSVFIFFFYQIIKEFFDTRSVYISGAGSVKDLFFIWWYRYGVRESAVKERDYIFIFSGITYADPQRTAAFKDIAHFIRNIRKFFFWSDLFYPRKFNWLVLLLFRKWRKEAFEIIFLKQLEGCRIIKIIYLRIFNGKLKRGIRIYLSKPVA